MKLYIGVTTYNRKDIVQYNAKSLLQVDKIENCEIHVFDDCSNEYNMKFLKKILKSLGDVQNAETKLWQRLRQKFALYVNMSKVILKIKTLVCKLTRDFAH